MGLGYHASMISLIFSLDFVNLIAIIDVFEGVFDVVIIVLKRNSYTVFSLIYFLDCYPSFLKLLYNLKSIFKI